MSRYPATVLTSLSPNDDGDDDSASSDPDADAEGDDQDGDATSPDPLATPSAAHLHLLNSECAGQVEWREAFQARAAVQTWSAALFTPPRRRMTPLVERSATPAEAASPAAAAAGAGAASSSSSSGGRGSHRGGGNDRNSNNSGGIVRSRSTSWSEERQRHAAARRGSGGGGGGSGSAAAAASAASAGDPAAPAPVFNNHTPREPRTPIGSGNITAITHPNSRGVRHSPAPLLPATLGVGGHASPLQRSRPLPIPNPSFGAHSHSHSHASATSSPHSHSHSRSLPPASPSPQLRANASGGGGGGAGALSRSPSLTASYSSVGSDLEELSLGGGASVVAGFDDDDCGSGPGGRHGRDPGLPLILTGHRAAVTCLQFDSSRLAVSAGKDVRMYSLRSGTLLEHLSVLKSGLLTCVDFGSARLVTAGTDCAMRCFDLESMSLERVTARKHAHSDVVTAVRLASNERAAVTASLDASLKLWSLDDGQCVATLNEGDRARTGMLLCMDAVSEVEFVAGSSAGGTGARVALFDVRSNCKGAGALVAHVGRDGHQQMVCSISYSAANAAIAAGGNDGTVHVLDARMLGSGAGAGARNICIEIPAPVSVSVPAPQQAAGAPAAPAAARAPSPLLAPSSSPSSSPSPAEVLALGGVPSPARTPPLPHSQSQSQSQAPLLLRAPIQSVHLDGSRLLVCQKRAVSVFSSASSSPSHLTGLPFAHLERQLSLDEAARFSRPTCPPPLNAFHYLKYSPQLQTMALATTDAVMVWLQARHVFDAQAASGSGSVAMMARRHADRS